MKKLSRYRTVFVVVFTLVLIAVVFVMYVMFPYQTKHNSMQTEIRQLQTSIKNENALTKKLDQVTADHQKVKAVLDSVNGQQILGMVEYQELLSYIGSQATEQKVDVVQFRSLPIESKDTHWIVPYELSVQGNYSELTKFVNSLYRMKNYFRISKMNMVESDYIPMTDKVKEGDASLSQLTSDWAVKFAERLDRYLPTDMLVGDEETANKEDSKVSEIPTTIEVRFYMEFLTLTPPDTSSPMSIELKETTAKESTETDEEVLNTQSLSESKGEG